MKIKEVLVAFSIFVLVAFIFFYKTIFFGQIPFPGDLLISEYSPWKFYSYLGYNPGSYPQKAQYFDVIRQLYPWKTLAIELLKNGQFPLWNPYSFSGSPLFANVQSAVLYPFNMLYVILPQVLSWTVLVMLQPLLASFFTYLYAREIKISKLASFLAAISYGYSLYMSVFLEYNTIGHTILWLPLTLLSIDKMLYWFNARENFQFSIPPQRDKFFNFQLNLKIQKYIAWFIIFIFSIVSSLFSGHLQIFSFMIIFVFAYFLFRLFYQGLSLRTKLYSLALFLAAHILAFGIGAVQLLPTFELIQLSARVSQEYNFLIEKLLIQPNQLILLFSPDFFGNPANRNYLIDDTYPGNALYIGLVPVLFAFMSLTGFRKNVLIKFFSLASLILIIFFTRSPITELFYRFEIPFFSTGSPTNAIFLLSFSLSILCGLGLNILINRTYKFFWKPILFFPALFAVIWIFVYTKSIQIISIKNFFYSTGILFTFFVLLLIFFLLKGKKSIIAVLFLIVGFFDLFYFFQKFNSFVPESLVFPEAKVLSWLQRNTGVNRFWGYGAASIEPNFSTQYFLFSPDGYDPLYPKRYGEFLYSSKDGKILNQFTNATRSDARIAPGFGDRDLADNRFRLKVLDVLGVDFVLDRVENASSEKTFPLDRFTLINQIEGWKVFKNLKAAPRAFFVSTYDTFKTKEEFSKKFFEAKDYTMTYTLRK